MNFRAFDKRKDRRALLLLAMPTVRLSLLESISATLKGGNFSHTLLFSASGILPTLSKSSVANLGIGKGPGLNRPMCQVVRVLQRPKQSPEDTFKPPAVTDSSSVD